MTEKNFNLENDKEFDALIESSLGELPPDHLTDEITPWRKATGRIIWGLALRMMVLELLGLNYILPLIGTFLTLLGFRALRRENKWFKACNVLNILYAVRYFASTILNATVFDYGERAAEIILVLNIVISLLLLIFLWQAFRAVRRKAGLQEGAKSAAALIVWYVVLAVLGLLHYQGLIIPILMIVTFVFMIRSMFKLSKELDEAGYAVNAAPVKISDKALTVALCSTLAICIVCGYAFFNSYPMKWAETEMAESAQITQIKEDLLELGFPEDVLSDISEEDILECEGATFVYSSEEYYSIGNAFNGFLNQDDNLRITGIGVKLPGEDENWKIFHHFLWVKGDWFCGTESLMIWPSYGYNTDWYPTSDISGRVLYDHGEKTYSAPYYFLDNKTYNSDSLLWGESTSYADFATFSLPQSGENRRGYISYSIEQANDDPRVLTWMNYTHQWHPFQYPVMTAMEKQMSGAFSMDGAFETAQDPFGFSPSGVVDGTEIEYYEE